MIGSFVRGVAEAIETIRRLARTGSPWLAAFVATAVGLAALYVTGEIADATVRPILDQIDPLADEFVRTDPLGIEVDANADDDLGSYFYPPQHTIQFAGVAFHYEQPLVRFLTLLLTAASLLWLLLPQPHGAPPPVPMARCPHCRSEIPAAARRCNSCRQPVTPNPPEVRVSDA